jgi:hypothetical protein
MRLLRSLLRWHAPSPLPSTAERLRRDLDRAGWDRVGVRPDRGYSVAGLTGAEDSVLYSVVDVEDCAEALAGYGDALAAAGWPVTVARGGRELVVTTAGR